MAAKVYSTQYIEGKGIRCRGKKGHFIKCPRRFAGDTGELGDMGEFADSDMGRVARKKYIKGKGLRCWDERGKFTSCFSGTASGTTSSLLGKTRKKRKSTTKRRVRIKGKGTRCRLPSGRFTKC